MPAATGDSCPALANARNIHRAMTRAHGQPRSRPQRSSTGPPWPLPASCIASCDANADDRETDRDVGCSAALAQTVENTRPPQSDLGRHFASARATERSLPTPSNTICVPPWVEMVRPSQPNVAHVDATSGSCAATSLRSTTYPRRSTREPRHVRLPTRPRHSATSMKHRHKPPQGANPNPTWHAIRRQLVGPSAPPLSPAQPAGDRPSRVESPDPHVTECRPQRTF